MRASHLTITSGCAFLVLVVTFALVSALHLLSHQDVAWYSLLFATSAMLTLCVVSLNSSKYWQIGLASVACQAIAIMSSYLIVVPGWQKYQWAIVHCSIAGLLGCNFMARRLHSEEPPNDEQPTDPNFSSLSQPNDFSAHYASGLGTFAALALCVFCDSTPLWLVRGALGWLSLALFLREWGIERSFGGQLVVAGATLSVLAYLSVLPSASPKHQKWQGEQVSGVDAAIDAVYRRITPRLWSVQDGGIEKIMSRWVQAPTRECTAKGRKGQIDLCGMNAVSEPRDAVLTSGSDTFFNSSDVPFWAEKRIILLATYAAAVWSTRDMDVGEGDFRTAPLMAFTMLGLSAVLLAVP